jgi:hypothetical protein
VGEGRGREQHPADQIGIGSRPPQPSRSFDKTGKKNIQQNLNFSFDWFN